jgi:hypothetical protein
MRARLAAVDQAVGHVVGHAQVGKQGVGLEHDAVVALGRRQAGDVPPVLHQRAAAVRLQPRHDAQQGGLAAARRPEKADELAALDGQVDVLQRGEAASAC